MAHELAGLGQLEGDLAEAERAMLALSLASSPDIIQVNRPWGDSALRQTIVWYLHFNACS